MCRRCRCCCRRRPPPPVSLLLSPSCCLPAAVSLLLPPAVSLDTICKMRNRSRVRIETYTQIARQRATDQKRYRQRYGDKEREREREREYMRWSQTIVTDDAVSLLLPTFLIACPTYLSNILFQSTLLPIAYPGVFGSNKKCLSLLGSKKKSGKLEHKHMFPNPLPGFDRT